MKLQLATHAGKVVHRQGHPRPYHAYYYLHERSLGYDLIGRAGKKETSIAAAMKKMIREDYLHVDIYLDNEVLVATLTAVPGGIRVKFRRPQK